MKLPPTNLWRKKIIRGAVVSDRIFAVIWLGICALISYQMLNLTVPFAYEPVGPKAFPMLLAVLMSICCAALIISPDRDILWPETQLLCKGAVLIAILLGYASLFDFLGFSLATALMVPGVCRLFGGRWISGVIAGVVIGGLGYLFFDRLLQVSLPVGRI